MGLGLQEILILVLLMVTSVFWIFAIWETFEDRRYGWFLAVVFFHFLGTLAYFVTGRRRRVLK